MAARKTKTYPIEVHAKPGQMLGMPVATFLRDYWQKRPLLIRNAFTNFETPLLPEDLAGLACEEGSLARLISHDGNDDQPCARAEKCLHGNLLETVMNRQAPGLPHAGLDPACSSQDHSCAPAPPAPCSGAGFGAVPVW